MYNCRFWLAILSASLVGFSDNRQKKIKIKKLDSHSRINVEVVYCTTISLNVWFAFDLSTNLLANNFHYWENFFYRGEKEDIYYFDELLSVNIFKLFVELRWYVCDNTTIAFFSKCK